MTAPDISFEFFPPQNLEASFRLWDTVQTLAPMDPRFVSVTYGAGGTTRDLTRDAVATLHKSSGLNVAAHLTCVNATRSETLAIADQFAEAGNGKVEPGTSAPWTSQTIAHVMEEAIQEGHTCFQASFGNDGWEPSVEFVKRKFKTVCLKHGCDLHFAQQEGDRMT